MGPPIFRLRVLNGIQPGLRPKRSARKPLDKRPRQNVPRLVQSEAPLQKNLSAAIAGATTWLPASSSVGIAVVANVSASAMDRRHGPGRRRSRSRFGQVDDRGWARKKARPLSIFRKIDPSYGEQPARIRPFAFQPIQFATGIVAE
jgi:hypothetical protein